MRPDEQGGPRSLLDVGEASAQRDLRRQIGALERNLNELRREHAPHDVPEDGESPAVGAENLEEVRDELLGSIYDLQERVAARFASGIEAPPPVAPPEPSRLRARLRRRGPS